MPAERRKHPAPVGFDSNGLAVLESHHAEDFFMEWRTDPFPKMLFVIAGSGTLHRKNETLTFRAPALCLVPARVLHRIEDDPGNPVSLYGLCIDRRRFPGHLIPAKVFEVMRVESEPEKSLLATIREILWERRLGHPGSEAMQVGIALRLFAGLARRTSSAECTMPDASRRVRAALREMEHSFWCEQDLDSCARRAGLSRRRFTQLFREAAGESWLARLTHLRIGHAKKLLTTTGLPVSQVAFESGFKDPAHFFRTFRAMTGRTPASFRAAGDR